MDKKDIWTGIIGTGILALCLVTVHLTRDTPQTTLLGPSYIPQPPRNNDKAALAHEKTAALTKLFETDAFKNGSSWDQRRLIEAIDKLYI